MNALKVEELQKILEGGSDWVDRVWRGVKGLEDQGSVEGVAYELGLEADE